MIRSQGFATKAIQKVMSKDMWLVNSLKVLRQKRALPRKKLSPLSLKIYFRTILALLANFDFELHQIDFKIVFLNGDKEETIYMAQTENLFRVIRSLRFAPKLFKR